MVCLTFAYVIATVVIVVLNKKSIDEMRATREAEVRPYLFSYLAFVPSEVRRCNLVLKNYGKTGATITGFSITPKLNLIKGENDCSFFEGTIIAPGQAIHMLVLDENQEMDRLSYQVSICYEDISKNARYAESYTLIQQYAGESGSVSITRSGMSKVDNAVIDIAHSLDAIKTSLL